MKGSTMNEAKIDEARHQERNILGQKELGQRAMVEMGGRHWASPSKITGLSKMRRMHTSWV